MADDEKWYFSKEQLGNTPSRKCGIDADKELSYRQQAANFIQDMGQRLVVSQLCINTAIVYMHRFYVYHSLTHFHRNSMAAAALFLAAKVEEQPRKLEHVIKVAHMCLHRDAPTLDTKADAYMEQAADLVFNENVLLQTLGFDVAIDHPHTHVVRCCHLVKASKDLAQTSYFMASNSLHLTTMCLQYKPTVVACFCIHLACKWSNWEIPPSNEGKLWFWYVDRTVTSDLLKTLTDEFLHIFDKCPSRLKRKIKSISASQSPNMNHPAIVNTPFEMEPRRVLSPANAEAGPSFQSVRPAHPDRPDGSVDPTRRSSSMSGRPAVDYREYREKKERERLEREKAAGQQGSFPAPAASGSDTKHHSHHHKSSGSGSSSNTSTSTSTSNMPNKHSSSSSSSMKQPMHHNNHHHSRQDVKSSASSSSSSQMMPQRPSGGSSSGQPRDPNRDRQRMSSRDSYGYAHASENPLETGASQDSGTVHPPEKLVNNVHKSHDNRPNDLRHQKQAQMPPQKDAKPYAKYVDPTSRSSSSSRKSDFEQKNEEVRKLIEKPLPPPKPRAEQMKEDYAAMMLKSSHHPSRYGHQAEKSLPNINATQTSALPIVDSKQLNVSQTAFTVDKSPNAPVSAAQMPQKSMSKSSSNSQGMPVKNGSSSSFSLPTLNNSDMSRQDNKRQRHVEQENPVQTAPPVVKHRSLFSPEKTPTPTPSPKESSHTQKLKQKQRTSPAMPKFDMPSFSSPSNSVQATSSTEQIQKQNRVSNSSSSSSQKHRSSNNTEMNMMNDATAAAVASIEQDMKNESTYRSKFVSTFNVAQEQPSSVTNNRMLDFVQAKENKNTIDMKPHSELTKTFDDTLNSVSNQRQHKQHHGLSNGMVSNVVKHEYSTIDPNSFLVKPELPEDILSNEIPSDLLYMKDEPKLDNFNSMQEHVVCNEIDISTAKQDTFSPLKSAQSISALLQEPLAMPSLLQVPSYEQEQQHAHDDKMTSLHMQQMQQIQIEPSLPSTVDMSELAPPPIQCTIDVPTTTAAPVTVPTVTVATESDKKSEHRSKSEKKKEKKKHKHKEKEKSKDKHKHKHKEKDREREKHRDKNDKSNKDKTEEGSSSSSGGAALGAEPIKITIPKDKINLNSESLGTSASSSIGSGLKIKIPKDRLKVSVPAPQPTAETESEQAPLKIKIRTAPSSQNSSSVTGSSSTSSSSRKRDRSEGHDGPNMPAAKKQQQQHSAHQQQQQQQQQRPNERQNGRHSSSYNASGNDKVRGGGRGAGPRQPPYPYQRYPGRQMREPTGGGAGGYRSYQHQQQSPPPPAFVRHPRPPQHQPYPFPGYHGQAMQAPPHSVFGVGFTPQMYDPTLYYQQYQQQAQYAAAAAAMYPGAAATGNFMMTVDGQIDTSVPPPPYTARHAPEEAALAAVTSQPPPPPLPSGPPPSSSPPPPPPPE